MKRQIGWALAMAGAMLGAPAMADVQGQASMSKLRFTLFDLDLTDSVTPSLEWIDPGAFGGALSVGYTASEGRKWSESYSQLIFLTDGEPTTIAHSPGSHAGIEVGHASPDPLGHRLWLSAHNGPLGATETAVRGFVTGQYLRFRLSPNTRVSLSLDFSAMATARPLASHEEYLQLYGTLHVSDAWDYDYGDADWRLLQVGFGYGAEAGDTLTLTADYSNPYDWVREGEVEAGLSAEAWARPVSAVPEPSAWSMLLAGVALLGRRRIQRRIDRPMVKAKSGVRLLSPRDSIASSCTSFDRR